MAASKWEVIVPVLLFLLINLQLASLRNDHGEEDCLSLLPESYDHTAPPKLEGKPMNVFVQLEVLDLDEINEETMDLRIHGFIRAVWDDPRFFPNRTKLKRDCLKYIWTPDMMFEEAKVIIETGQNNIFFAVRKDHFYFSQRYAFKVTCMMDFHLYPFDVQQCTFSIAFMATDDSAAQLKWFDDVQSPYKDKLAVELTKEVNPLQFILQPPKTYSIVRPFAFANFTYLLAEFTLTRRLTGTIINYYMPSSLLVVISWVTFWLREDAASERVTLIMTALLTICTQGDQYKDELPPVNYITAMDIWFFVCIFMLFATLVEFAFSYNAYREKKKRKFLKKSRNSEASCLSSQDTQNSTFANENFREMPEEARKGSKLRKLAMIFHLNKTTNLDSVCKVVFPGFFLLFFVVYWTVYLCIPVVSIWSS